jgi:hypothetical protein
MVVHGPLPNYKEEATAFPRLFKVGIHDLGLKPMRSFEVSRRDYGITVATQIVIETYATGLEHTLAVHRAQFVTARAYSRAPPVDWFGGSSSQRQRKKAAVVARRPETKRRDVWGP